MRLTYSNEAKRDLLEISDFIALDNAERAITFVGELRKEIKKLRQFPNMGKEYHVYGYEHRLFRWLFYKGYTVVYEVCPDCVIVHEVFNQAKENVRLKAEKK